MWYFMPILLTGAFCGVCLGLLGVMVVGMRMPFIGSCISHTAMVGAVYAMLFGMDPTAGAIGLSMVGAAGAGMAEPSGKRLDANTGQAVLLALMMGLVFLAVGLEDGSRAEMLSLLWGNVLFADWWSAAEMGGMACVLVGFMVVFDKAIKAMLFSWSLTRVDGWGVRGVYMAFLCLSGIVLAISLEAVGGLLIFSLLVCPAGSAYRIGKGYRSIVVLSVVFGVCSTVLGFFVSYWFELPTGACTVLVTVLIYGGCRGWEEVISYK